MAATEALKLGPSRTWAVRAPAILVIEDDFLTATHVCDVVRDCGCAIAASVPRVAAGLEFLADHQVDGAIVDINLRGTSSFPLCAELGRRKVPFFFLTGYEPTVIPPEYRGVPVLSKPATAPQIESALRALLPRAETAPVETPEAHPFDNLVLRGLHSDDRRLVEPRLEPVALDVGAVLDTPGVPASHLVFPSSGLVSVETGAGPMTLQLAMIGREGMTGTSLLLGRAGAAHTATVHYPGKGLRMEASTAHVLLDQNHRLRDHLLSAVGATLAQISLNAVNAGCCTIERRVARWLLMVSRRIDSQDIAVTHEKLARMLAVRRAGRAARAGREGGVAFDPQPDSDRRPRNVAQPDRRNRSSLSIFSEPRRRAPPDLSRSAISQATCPSCLSGPVERPTLAVTTSTRSRSA